MSGGRWDYRQSVIGEIGKDLIKSKEEIELGILLIKIEELIDTLDYAYCGDVDIEDFKEKWKKFKEENLKNE